jgi:hypothetical protein
MNSSSKPGNDEAPLAADGGIPFRPRNDDAFARFFELMEVVEMLCPKWPEREHRIDGIFLL